MSTDDYVVNGYRLTNLMMTGQNSQVWEAVQEATGRRFALKLLLPERVQDPQQRRFIAHEAKVAKGLNHPRIIKVLDYYPEKDNPHFVMEFFPSSNMKLSIVHKKEVIKECAQTIVEQSAQALAYLHDKSWVHRDVKPDNFLLNGTGEIRLIDFALAQKIGGLGRFLRRSPIQGTRSYMSPEQIRGQRLDQQSDVYGFGCTLFELCTGRPPFRADSPRELLLKHLYQKVNKPAILNSALTAEMNDLIMRMLQKKREQRLKDMHEFIAEFRSVKVYSP